MAKAEEGVYEDGFHTTLSSVLKEGVKSVGGTIKSAASHVTHFMVATYNKIMHHRDNDVAVHTVFSRIA
jgi:hypothetical protein